MAVVVSVIMLVDFVELTRTLGAKGEIGFWTLVELMALKSPSVALELLPFVFMFGTMAAIVAMNRRGELVAMRAAGISAWRFLFPSALAAFAIGVVAIAALGPAAASLNARYETERANLTDAGARGELWLRQITDAGQIVVRARARDTVNGAVRLRGVSVFVLAPGGGASPNVSRRIDAEEALLLPGSWKLNHVREARPGAETLSTDSLSLPSTLDRRSTAIAFLPPGAVNIWDLPRTIREAVLAGYSPAAYQLRFQQLLAEPLLLAAMTLLAAGFSMRLIRLGDLGLTAAGGIAIGMAVFFLNQFCGALGASGVIAPFLAAWGPPVIAALTAAGLLTYTEDG